MSYKRDLFSVECEVPGLLRLTPIPGCAGTPHSLIAGCATLIPVTGKVNIRCHSDVVKPLQSFEIPENRIRIYDNIAKSADLLRPRESKPFVSLHIL